MKPCWAILLAGVIALGIYLRISAPPVAERSPDENYYMYFAEQAVRSPFDAPRELTRLYNTVPERWPYPMPFRMAYYYMIAAVMELRHVTAERAGVTVSICASVAQLLMVAGVGLRFFNRWMALVAVALLAVCPADLVMSRRVWGDGLVGCVGMMYLWISAEIAVRPRARGWWYLALWASGWFLLMLKEITVVFYSACALALIVQSCRARAWTRAVWLCAGAVCAALCSFITVAIMCGGVPALLEVVRHNASTLPGNSYANLSQNGPWYSLPLALWVVSPFTTAFAAVGIAASLAPARRMRRLLSLSDRGEFIARVLSVLILVILTAATVPRYFKDLRYLSVLLGSWHLVSALGVCYAVMRVREIVSPRRDLPLYAAAAVAVLLSCGADYSRYRHLFLRPGVDDLNAKRIVELPFDFSSQ